jgi:hypothetical protein
VALKVLLAVRLEEVGSRSLETEEESLEGSRWGEFGGVLMPFIKAAVLNPP